MLQDAGIESATLARIPENHFPKTYGGANERDRCNAAAQATLVPLNEFMHRQALVFSFLPPVCGVCVWKMVNKHLPLHADFLLFLFVEQKERVIESSLARVFELFSRIYRHNVASDSRCTRCINPARDTFFPD